MRRLVLVGLPGTGKTTLAHRLAECWNAVALDTDEELARDVGVSAGQFLAEHGESTFRARELDALRNVLARDGDVVIATGGGIVCTPAARDALTDEWTIWLDCDDDVLLTRLGAVERPLLAEDPAEALSLLRETRSPWYEAVSRVRVDTSGSIDDVTALVTREVDRLTR